MIALETWDPGQISLLISRGGPTRVFYTDRALHMVEDISLFFLEMLNSRTGNRGVQSMTHTKERRPRSKSKFGHRTIVFVWRSFVYCFHLVSEEVNSDCELRKKLIFANKTLNPQLFLFCSFLCSLPPPSPTLVLGAHTTTEHFSKKHIHARHHLRGALTRGRDPDIENLRKRTSRASRST